MNKEEKLKEFCKKHGLSIGDLNVTRMDDLRADVYTLKNPGRSMGGIIIADDGRSLFCGTQYSLEKYIEDFKNGRDDNTISPEVYEKTLEKDANGKYIRLCIPTAYLKELGFDTNNDLDLIGKSEEDLSAEELSMLLATKKSLENRIDKSLQLSNGKYADSQETKETFERFMDKVDNYNEQIANGQTPDISMGDLAREYKNTFYDEELEAKEKKREEELKNREPDTKIDNLINEIDNKLKDSYVLKRSELLDMFLEFEKNISRDNLNMEYVKTFLNELSMRIELSKPNSDTRFEPYGRMLFLQKELDKYLNEKNYFDAIYDIKDYLCDSRNTAAIPPELFDKNKEYFDEDIICSEEKEILIDMIYKYLNAIEDNYD